MREMKERWIAIEGKDEAAWERFEELAGDEAAAALTQFVRRYVADREPDERGMRRIEVPVVNDQKERETKAFRGRWLIDPVDGVVSPAWSQHITWGIAETEGGRFVAHTHHHRLAVPDEFDVFEKEEELAGAVPEDIYAKAAAAMGRIPIEELDI